MSVLIKGMKMPMCCADCDLSIEAFDGSYTHLACRRLGEWCVGENECRLDNCPLIDLPMPHGRLIDANKAIVTSKQPSVLDLTDCAEFIRECKTIIEAEE